MKRIIGTVLALMLCATVARAGGFTPGTRVVGIDGFPFCLSDEAADEFATHIINSNEHAMLALVLQNVCNFFDGGTGGTVLTYSGWSERVSVRLDVGPVVYFHFASFAAAR